jgi:hypothetical protein
VARRLKGTVVNPQPSWNIKRMFGSAVGTGPLGIGDIGAIGLLNTGSAGEWLVVWDVQVNIHPSASGSGQRVLDGAIRRGTESSLLFTEPNNPLASAVASGPGQVWAAITGFEAGGIFFSGIFPADVYQWPHEWPICAIQPGDSLVFYSDGSAANNFSAMFLYEVVPGGL